MADLSNITLPKSLAWAVIVGSVGSAFMLGGTIAAINATIASNTKALIKIEEVLTINSSILADLTTRVTRLEALTK